MTQFLLEILTPEKNFFKDKVDALVVDCPDGQKGILAGHSPMVVAVRPSIIKITQDGVERIASNGQGFVDIRPNKVILLCQTIEWPEELEEARIQEAIQEHEAKVRSAKTVQEYNISKAALARAYARQRAIKRD